MFRRVMVMLLVAGLAAVGLVAAPAVPAQEPQEGVRTSGSGVVPGSWFVLLKKGVSPRESFDIAADHGGKARHVYWFVLRGFNFRGTQGQKDSLATDPRVAKVTPDYAVHATAFEPGMRRIGVPSAHGSATGSGTRVAVLDTGIASHSALPNVDRSNSKNCSGSSPGSHGTNVAGIVGAQSSSQTGGVAPGATLLDIQVLTSSGGGSWTSIICGIDHVTALNTANPGFVDVMNMSLGGASGFTPGEPCSARTVRQAICNAYATGVTIVAAAGNESSNTSGFAPANYPEVIAVSAINEFDGSPGTDRSPCQAVGRQNDCDDEFAWYSNYGSKVDLIAPGSNVRSTWTGNGYGSLSGTSQSSPHVAGVAALILQRNPGLTNEQVRQQLKITGDCPNGQQNGVAGPCSGKGSWPDDRDSITEPIVNAARAAGGGSAPPPPPADTTGPTVTWNSPSSGQQFQQGATVAVDVNVSDASGVSSVLWRRTGTSYTAMTNAGGGRYTASFSTSGLSGNQTIEIQATDGASTPNVTTASRTISVTTTQPPPTGTWTRVNQSGVTGTSYSSGWRLYSDSSAYGGNYARTTTRNAFARYTFSGTGVRWIGISSPNGGIADVYLDGVKVATIDQFRSGSTALYQQVMFERTGLTSGSHTIEVRATGARNPSASDVRSYVDAWERLS